MSETSKRITVTLTPRAKEAMEKLIKRNKESQTGIVNDAVELYAKLVGYQDQGGGVFFKIDFSDPIIQQHL